MKQENKYLSLKELEEIIKDNRQRIKDFPTTNGKIEARAFNENQLQVLYLAKEYLEHGEGEYEELTDFYRNYTSILSKLYKPKPKKELNKMDLFKMVLCENCDIQVERSNAILIEDEYYCNDCANKLWPEERS